ncbi:unannotated protein [freshwater metagenome]|uniref:Unannotated protein n=1 Tax=freshwater metagenome TaxID=449393 RepID=A0A6J7XTS3_9ZZZZ
MTDLRFIGKTPDGVSVTLADTNENEFTLRISDSLRSAINAPRLSSVPSQDDANLTVAEIQRRLRAGESAQDLAQESGTSIEKIERFSGPIMQERSYIIDRTHAIVMKKELGEDPQTLYDMVMSRLLPRGVGEDALEWSAWRHHDGTWSMSLSYPNNDGHGDAVWHVDLSRNAVTANDENARWMMGEQPAPHKNYERPSPASQIYTETLTSVHTEVREEPDAEIRETPRLIAIRDEPDAAARLDGVTGRAKVPSWDEIMFGKTTTQEEEN